MDNVLGVGDLSVDDGGRQAAARLVKQFKRREVFIMDFSSMLNMQMIWTFEMLCP